MATAKKNGLGKGLDSLITNKVNNAKTTTATIKPAVKKDEKVVEGILVNINKVEPNREQPRKNFDEDALLELAESIKQFGVLQPLLVQQKDDYYEIIAGERRWRAAKLANLKEVPVIIKKLTEQEVVEISLIENIQREDLNAVEIALAYQHLLDQYELTQERLSERIGKNRTTIANYLRLLKLPAPIQMALQNKQIDMGHARALISLGDPKLQVKIFEEIQEHGYSVRKVEEIVKSLSEGEAVKSGTRKITPKRSKLPEEFNLLKQQLTGFFNTKVQLTCSEKGKGKISIPFSNEEELERIMEIFDSLKK